MNDELSAILGKYEELVGKLQEKYGIAKDEAWHCVDEYKIIIEQLKQENRKLIKLHNAVSIKKSDNRQIKLKRESWKKKPSNSDVEFLVWQKTIAGNSDHADLTRRY